MKRYWTIGAVASIIPVICGAQAAPQSSSFALLLRGDTIFEERAARTATEMRGEFRDKLRGARISYAAIIDAKGVITRLDARTYASSADTSGQRATFVVTPDSVTGSLNGSPPSRLRVDGNALLLLNPAVAFIEQLVIHTRALGRDTAAFPIYIVGAPQQPMAVQVARVSADSFAVAYAGVVMRLAVTPDGRVQGGVIPAQGIVIARGTDTSALASAPRVDYAAPPGAPYTAEEVVVKTASGLRLKGTLTVPRDRPRGGVPAVVTITGSGPEDRD